MPPKALFHVKLQKTQEKDPIPSSIMATFALPGTESEAKVLRKERQFNFIISKSRLSDWNLNIPNQQTLPSQSSTSILHGMPTPQTPMSSVEMGYTMKLGTDCAMDTVDWLAQEASFLCKYARNKNIFDYLCFSCWSEHLPFMQTFSALQFHSHAYQSRLQRGMNLKPWMPCSLYVLLGMIAIKD